MRGRPPGSEDRNLSKSLLIAAEAKLHDKSHLDLTTREIAEMAGTHAGMVNYYFHGKEGLLFAMLDDIAKDADRHLDSIENSIENDDEDPTERIVRGLMEAYYRQASVYSVFFIELFRAAAPIREFYSRRREFIFIRLEKIIRRLVAKGIYRSDLDAKMATWVFLSLIIGPLVSKQMCQAHDASIEPMPTEAWIENIVSMLRKDLLANVCDRAPT